MSVEDHYKNLADRLIIAYARQSLLAPTSKYNSFLRSIPPLDKKFLNSIAHHATIAYQYQTPSYLDQALDLIDLPKIYGGVERREEDSKSEGKLAFGYEDFLVLELLDYFKNSFFKWINKPKCQTCHTEDHVQMAGVDGPPLVNPDQITITEKYTCTQCGMHLSFSRINNPVSLLRTRKGRCGEWVNCFMLILQAVLGSEAQIRYVWNHEDHVWCEYYSTNLRRWVHLDPCEAAFDQPSLYCENWGKKMSWVFGFGLGYTVDLSDKYITQPDKQLSKTPTIVSSEKTVSKFIDYTNSQLLKRYYETIVLPELSDENSSLLKLYQNVILLKNRERISSDDNSVPTKTLGVSQPGGRQSGSAEWTKSRGESGK